MKRSLWLGLVIALCTLAWLPHPLGRPPLPVRPPAPKQPVLWQRIGNLTEGGGMTRYVRPRYPASARKARIQGIVEFRARISKEGKISSLELVRGNPVFIDAATKAVRQWRYRPTRIEGQPIETITDILIDFTLNQ